MSHFDELPGRDMESRAQLYRVVMTAPALLTALEALSPEAAARIGLAAEDRDRLSLTFSRALWASTADLHQQGRDTFARQVTARAKELAEEKESRP